MEKELFNDDEYQLYDHSNDNLDDVYYDDIKRAYIKEIAKYPLLTEEEEIRYGKMLKNPENKKILVIKNNNNFITSDLNIPVLFYSLCDNTSYKMIIDNLIKFYGRLNSNNDKTIEILQRYLKESSLVNRALTKEEIFNIFHLVDVNNALNEKDLLFELKEFMNYKFAFDKMFVSNLRLVLSLASKYSNRKDYMDLINEGNMGLLRAIQGFDIDLEYKFSTYATHWIRMSIQRYVANFNSVIKIPEHYLYEIYSYKRQVDKLEQELGRRLSYDEISDMLNIPMETIQKYNLFMKEDVYLDTEINEDGDLCIKDSIPSDVSIEDECFKVTIQEDIEKMFFCLSARELFVIKMYYGLGEYKGKDNTIYEIAKVLQVSPQRINQIKTRAIFKMKRAARFNKDLSEMRAYIK